jgi:hypothetical protein
VKILVNRPGGTGMLELNLKVKSIL